jgi:TonB family protein
MKAVSKLVLLLSAGVLPVVAASAASPSEQTYLETCRKDSEVPVPVSVVSPTVDPEYNGAVVQLEFTVQQNGIPVDFSIKSTPDDVLAKAVVEAVKQWRFQPAAVNGSPISKRCSLPVKIVEAPLGGFAAL